MVPFLLLEEQKFQVILRLDLQFSTLCVCAVFSILGFAHTLQNNILKFLLSSSLSESVVPETFGLQESVKFQRIIMRI